jgi:hypothetical protein
MRITPQGDAFRPETLLVVAELVVFELAETGSRALPRSGNAFHRLDVFLHQERHAAFTGLAHLGFASAAVHAGFLTAQSVRDCAKPFHGSHFKSGPTPRGAARLALGDSLSRAALSVCATRRFATLGRYLIARLEESTEIVVGLG